MATPYSVVEGKFLTKISDRYISSMFPSLLQEMIDSYRESAEVTFKKCSKLLDKDDTLKQYNQTLTNEEIDILANCMVIEWSYPTVNNIDNLKMRMTTADYRQFSQANMIEATLEFIRQTEIRVKRSISSYVWTSTDLGGLN